MCGQGVEEIIAEPVPGNDLILTIDRSIQFQAEEQLRKRVEEVSAKSGTIVIMDTDTGDLLAMASVDRNDDGVVDMIDYVKVTEALGPCTDPGGCPEDVDGSGVIDYLDQQQVLLDLGPCPDL